MTVTVEEMEKAINHQVKVVLKSGKVSVGDCYDYQYPQDEDEYHNIAVRESDGIGYEINQHEIESIEILE